MVVEKTVEVRTYKVKAYCDDCKTILAYNFKCLPAYPPKYEHVCTNCNKVYEFNKVYPTIEYKEIADDKA